MSNNYAITPGSGDAVTGVDVSTFTAYPSTGKIPASVIYVSSTSGTVPTPLTNANPLPVSLQNASIAVTGTFYQATQPVSASALPLPTGASTAAKQPALGTAGTASSDVLTVQGIASMTALKVDGSAVTQPVSGTFWQATQPVSIASAVPVTDNSGSLTVDAPVGTPVYVRLSDGSSAISTLPVSLASVPSHAVTNAGTFAVQSTLQSGTNTIGYVNSISAGDTIEIAGTTYTVKAAFANATSSGNTTVVTAVASKKIRVLAFSIGPVSAAVNVYFNNATTGAICSTKYLGVNGGMGRGLNHFGHFTTGTNNEDLRVNLSTTANVGIDVLYIEV